MHVKDTPSGLNLPPQLQYNPQAFLLRGGSCIINPEGEYIMQPQFDREDIFIVELPSTNATIKGKMTLDVSGHYNRPDIFNFSVNRNRPSDIG